MEYKFTVPLCLVEQNFSIMSGIHFIKAAGLECYRCPVAFLEANLKYRFFNCNLNPVLQPTLLIPVC